MKSRVAVIGLGRIGLPIALTTAKNGYAVYGIDTNAKLVKELEEGRLPFFEPGLKQLLRFCRSRFHPTTDLKNTIDNCKVVLCCVGTRRFARNRPNLRLLYKIFRDLAQFDLNGKLIILKTTVPIGTTRDLANFLERTTRLRPDHEFYLAFSPERIVEGKAIEELRTLPVIVGAVGQRSLRRVVSFYRGMKADVRSVGSAEAAEFVKLIDNTYRITRFAFSNEIALIAERLGLNAYEIIDAANYRYPRNSIPYPSCGVSGYCLTKDPSYLEEAFRPIRDERGFSSIWMTARRSYDFRTKSVVKDILRYLRRRRLARKEMRILICGIAFKPNIDDIRDSHGLLMANDFARSGVDVSVWDPCVSETREFRSYEDPRQAFKGKDAAIFTVAHKQFLDISKDIQGFTKLMRTPLIYDGAGILRKKMKFDGHFILIGTGLPNESIT